MSSRLLFAVVWILAATLTAPAQDKLYPIRPTKDLPGVPILVSSDRMSFVIERSFQHKITIGFPSEDRMDYLPETKALVVFWFRIQNTSRNPLRLDPAQFSAMDDSGRMSPIVVAEVATDRIMSGLSGNSSLGTKALRRVSLGRAGHKPTVEEVREDIVRYSLKPSEVPPGGVKEGFIYFEEPQKKKYTLNVSLGELWSQPLPFSTEKQK